MSCLEIKSDAMVDHLLKECDLIGKFLQTDKNPLISGDNKVYGVFLFMILE
jgi:serine/threonine-protein phosphatase 6 regulatory subunit 3